ncbi:transcription factor bHLH143-like [Andrographis paniculata]|uniref:transcription factor bHLH143-like n=1 Tax=Andrographis paniculata TaxID=175694 RepID=UPI0021E76FF7|nr:transcription factor bHLH143-like [Andrographis paniculata]XP_051144314.1 transcription factor bHLH143-like [Andrographis paniculata]XP_051144315.1 transcription factor bHLH143-like [Andrographis paniculata]XP_051144316.1 transcription factor bHLH143-like [Andrographis paniculata]
MFAAKESQTNQKASARNSSNLDYMALLKHESFTQFPCVPPAMRTSSADFPGFYTSDFHGLNAGQQDTVGGVLKLDVPYCNISNPTGRIYPNKAQCALPYEFDVSDKVINASCAPQKRFLIFDQSGSHTRLFFSQSFRPGNQTLASKSPAIASGQCDKIPMRMDSQFLTEQDFIENWGENDLIEGEGEMREDTEEINALLYSDSDYDDDDGDDDGENDEVTSTGHSPFIIEEECTKDNELHEEELTEVLNSDELPKRRRLLDGKYKKSSLANAKNPMSQPVSHCYEDDDVESSCAGYYNPHDTDLHKRAKKLKIREALSTLASIIPGLSVNDPLSVIDEAIVYLKSMKAEAESLQLSSPLPDLFE